MTTIERTKDRAVITQQELEQIIVEHVVKTTGREVDSVPFIECVPNRPYKFVVTVALKDQK